MAMAYYGAGHGRRMIVKLFTFIERYGHQQESYLRTLTLRELQERADELGELLNQERESFHSDLVNPD